MAASSSSAGPAQVATVDMKGPLKRHIGGLKGWALFQYVKRGVYLEEYRVGEDVEVAEPSLVIDISHAKIIEQPGKPGFTLRLDGGSQGEVELLAPSVEEKLNWLKALAKGHDMLESPSPAALIAPVRRRHTSVNSSNIKRDRGRIRIEDTKRDEPYRVLTSLRVNLMEADKLVPPKKHRLSLYCVVVLDGRQRSLSTTKHDNNKPFWAEEFFYDTHISPTSDSLVLVLNNGNTPRNPRIAQTMIHLQSLAPGQLIDAWYPLSTMDKKDKRDKPCGTLRVKVTFTLEKILPYSEYADLLELIMDSDLTIAKALARVCNTQLDEVAGTLVNIFALNNRVNDFVRTLTTLEILKTDSGSIIFRGNTLSTKVLDIYMKMVGLDYLQEVLGPLVDEVLQDAASCEIDPSKTEKGEDVTVNQKRLQYFVAKCFDTIDQSTARCPEEMKLVFANIQHAVQSKFKDGIEKFTSVSGFIFLRFFCPAILNPSLFGIVTHVVTGRPARTLTLIAKTLQNLANLVTFNSKEPYMKVMTPYLEATIPRCEDCITRFSSPNSSALGMISDSLDRKDLSREMAAMERHCTEHLPALQNLAKQEPNPKYDRLFSVLANLQQRIKYYEANPTALPPNEVYDRMKRLSRILETDAEDVLNEYDY